MSNQALSNSIKKVQIDPKPFQSMQKTNMDFNSFQSDSNLFNNKNDMYTSNRTDHQVAYQRDNNYL